MVQLRIIQEHFLLNWTFFATQICNTNKNCRHIAPRNKAEQLA